MKQSNSISEFLHWTDSISNELCKVADPATLCASADCDALWKNAATEANRLTQSYMSQLNSDVEIYELFKHALSTYDCSDEQDQRMLQDLINDSRRDGVTLEDANERERVRKLSSNLNRMNFLVRVLL
eukprot:TRINITY_DN5505_c0_g1_i8.p1 TRINITY_DN5505_c0_g1~~TRINITY_DN5505_c0_g1_i8.p1  ORF type:complete len:128 (-),score=28.10 TRINITY_DN5505_c0_g1_i8:23-406(-)